MPIQSPGLLLAELIQYSGGRTNQAPQLPEWLTFCPFLRNTPTQVVHQISVD